MKKIERHWHESEHFEDDGHDTKRHQAFEP